MPGFREPDIWPATSDWALVQTENDSGSGTALRRHIRSSFTVAELLLPDHSVSASIPAYANQLAFGDA